MAKDDYDVIVYKVLLYLYAVLKRKISFDRRAFDALIERQDIAEEYFVDILRMMTAEELIEGAVFVRTWSTDYILISPLSQITITAKGIRYLKDNSAMKKVMESLRQIPGMVSDLIGIVKPF